MSSSCSPLQVGQVVRIQGLVSDIGQSLNHQRAVLVARDESLQRWKCRVKGNGRANFTGIRHQHLVPVEHRPLPTHQRHRGVTMATQTSWEKAMTVADLLVQRTETYTPPDTMLMGEAGMAFMRLGQDNFVTFSADQIEHLAGVLALYGMCREGKHEEVLFALLEAHPMTLDLVLATMTSIPWIGPEQRVPALQDLHLFYDSDLTPDQDEDVYIQTMIYGPVGLLTDMAEYVFGKALFGALKRSRYSLLFVRRLLRWIAREGLEEVDGLQLGKAARRVCEEMLYLRGNIPLVTRVEGERLLVASDSKLSSIRAATDYVQSVLIDKQAGGHDQAV